MTGEEGPPSGETIKYEMSRLFMSPHGIGRGAPRKFGGYKTGCILSALLNYGLDPGMAAGALGYSRKSVDDVLARAVAAGIISEDRKTVTMGDDWMDERIGGLAFVLDVMVLDGQLKYVKGEGRENDDADGKEGKAEPARPQEGLLGPAVGQAARGDKEAPQGVP